MKHCNPLSILSIAQERSGHRRSVGAQQFASFRRVEAWEGDAMILRETLFQQGPEYCASLFGGRVPCMAEWLQWIEVSVARMTTSWNYTNGDWSVRLFQERGFQVINFWPVCGEKRRRVGELESLVSEFADAAAYELYPAESRLVDSGDEYHLWIPTCPDWNIGLGKSTACSEVPKRLHRGGLCAARDGSLSDLLEEFSIRWEPPFGGAFGGKGSWVGQGAGFVVGGCVVWACQIGDWFRLWIWSLEEGLRAGWAEVQRIKNDLIGSEHEGVEVLDSSIWHDWQGIEGPVEVWVMAEAGIRLPFGYQKRWVNGAGLSPVFPGQAWFSESQRAASA